jgi:hypothetical protein
MHISVPFVPVMPLEIQRVSSVPKPKVNPSVISASPVLSFMARVSPAPQLSLVMNVLHVIF